MFEYELLTLSDLSFNDRRAKLNEMGEQGWELVASHFNGKWAELIFKRAKTAKVLYGKNNVTT